MKVSIIIVNYNVAHFLEQALRSVRKASKELDVEVFVVDNNSVDNSVEMVQTKFPEVKLIANKDNVGFSKANNQAIKKAKGEYILLLNPDTVIEETTLKKCCQFMDDHADAGALGVKMLDGSGNFLPESKRGLPTPNVAFYKVSGLARLFPRSKTFGRYHLKYLDENETNEVEILAGAFMFIRKKALDKIGLLDEAFFMYGEDIDLSYRIIKAGYKNYYFPETRIIHYKGESTKKTSINYVFIFYRAMIVFAQKHFSKKNARFFSFLINIAIWFKAFAEVAQRFVNRAIHPVIDASLIFSGMYLLKEFWEQTHKPDPGDYPPELMTVAVPIYIVIWMLSVHFSGGNDRPFNLFRVIRGVLIGTVIISAISNYFESYRFSKSLILIGGLWGLMVFVATRLLAHAVKYGNLKWWDEKEKKILIVGNAREAKRVMRIIKEANIPSQVLGYVGLSKDETRNKARLGSMDQIEEVIKIYDADELIFCSKDIPANQIIEWMTSINNKLLEFKIAPDESNYIIGSHSKNKQGSFYTLNIDLNIIKSEQIRNKRVLDVLLSTVFIVCSPLLMWFTERPSNFLSNAFKVIWGRYSWVGFASKEQVNLPKIKKGILTPLSSKRHDSVSQDIVIKEDMRYAKDYSILEDLRIVLSAFSLLGGNRRHV